MKGPLISRRTFLNGGIVAIAGAARARGARDAAVINTCGGFDIPADASLDAAAIRDALASDTIAVNQTLGYVFGDGEPFEQSVREIGVWDERIRRAPQLIKVYRAADVDRAARERRLGIIFGFQNAAMLGDRSDRVDMFADLGVRIIQLTYNNENRLGRGALAPGTSGLTPFGREVVGRLNARRVIVDLAHSSDQVCLDAAGASAHPIAISHTGCRALAEHPRNTTDQAMRLVASKGGYVGIFFMPYLAPDRTATARDVVAHLEHAIDICGEDHVGVGTDNGTTAVDLNALRVENAKDYARRSAAGVAAPGESPDTLPLVPDLTGPDQFRTLSRLLTARGHRAARIEKILSGNFLRFARELWG